MFFTSICIVNAESVELNKLSIEGNDIELEKGVYEYNITLSTDYSNISVYPIVADGISYKVIGNNDIKEGKNIIIIDVTDGVSTVKYTINVFKNAEEIITLSNNNRLKNLSISGYPLGFDSDKLEYNLTIGSEAKLKINYKTESDKAEVYVYGNEDLVTGSIIRVKVIAQSGDVREYKINITATEEREEIEIYEEKEEYDLQLIIYVSTALLVTLLLAVINATGQKEEKK